MKFRFARDTNNLEAIITFYTQILGLEILGSFKDHDGFDGVFLGDPNENWHLEFTKSKELVVFNFGEENILVFYPQSLKQYDLILENSRQNNGTILKAKNPYWNANGILFLDPDGYRIIVSHLNLK